MKIGADSPEDRRRGPIIFVELPNLSPIKRYDKQKERFLNIKKVMMWTSDIATTAMPRSILRVPIWNFNLVFEHSNRMMCNANKRKTCPFFFLMFSYKVWSMSYFFRSYVSYLNIISRERKKRDGGGRLCICWMVHVQHAVRNIQTRKIERVRAKQRPCQHHV